jgi:hypothetical protein
MNDSENIFSFPKHSPVLAQRDQWVNVLRGQVSFLCDSCSPVPDSLSTHAVAIGWISVHCQH